MFVNFNDIRVKKDFLFGKNQGLDIIKEIDEKILGHNEKRDYDNLLKLLKAVRRRFQI